MSRQAGLLTVAALVGFTLLMLGTQPIGIIRSNVSAQNPSGPAQSDHALLGPSDDAVYCGVGRNVEPYTLHVGVANNTDSMGWLTITFGDGDTMTFHIPAHSSFSTTQALGGVPGVDDVVKIEVSDSASAMASVQVNAGAADPFSEDGELDNFCLTTPDDPGTTPF